MGLGPAYRKLWTAAAVSTVGDGMHYAALALLAASPTRDPLAVSAVVFAGQFPLLLFSLPGGALVDRWDRRTPGHAETLRPASLSLTFGSPGPFGS